jgi:uncharacterized phage protein (TIGR01671 family)
MREIKFRAWDAMNKRMFIPKYLVVDETTGCHEPADLGTSKGRVYDTDDYLDGGLYTENNGHWLLMQFTGLKDKNGVEIYEGDIVRVWVDEFRKAPMVVSWDTEGLSWSIGGLMGADYDVFLVIGNICENPELLK